MSVNKPNNFNVNYFKIPGKHRGPQNIPRQATCAQRPRVWDPTLCISYVTISNCCFRLWRTCLFQNQTRKERLLYVKWIFERRTGRAGIFVKISCADMKRDLHILNLGFITLKRNVRFDSTDHDCPEEPPRSEWAPNHSRFLEGWSTHTQRLAFHKQNVAHALISLSYGNCRRTFYPVQLRTKVSKDENKQTTDNLSTNVTSVLRDHVSDREQTQSGRLVSFDALTAVFHWLWYQVMLIGRQAQHAQRRQRSETYRAKCLHSAEYPGRSCPQQRSH